ncbi:MAG: glycosyltransferase family 2 protein, partial [Proteobacteria bacterium]|nr:glycosyltransferase family 2 protein [Pseudomonadota bacterium]
TVSFNAQETIVDTLRSVAEQSYHNIEHIVVDGGSKDSTVDLVIENSSRVFRFVSERDNGLYDAMNKGIRMASGDVIGFINADDFYPSSQVLAEVAKVFEDSSIDACYSDLCYVKQDKPKEIVRYWKSSSCPKNSFTNSWVPPHPTFFVRREVYERLSGFNLDYRIAADFELMLRFLKVNSIKSVYVPRVWVHMRLGGTTNRSVFNIIKQNKEIIRALNHHGYSPSLAGFLLKKIHSRAWQFIVRRAHP